VGYFQVAIGGVFWVTIRANPRISCLQKVDSFSIRPRTAGSGSKYGFKMRRNVVKSRKIFCQLSVKRLGDCGADVERFLGITTSAVNRLASSTEVPEIE